MVRDCLSQFCLSSGLKVNATKTRVFYSKNVHHTRSSELSSVLGYSQTADLGKYLGVPLHPKRVGKESFHGVIDKVKARLNMWKANSLSLAGRATLISSVSSAIPAYTMQTSYLPSSDWEKLDKHNRSFLWGSTSERRKVSLVAWDEVCKPKRQGGLGLRHAKYQNQAFLMKVGWRMVTHREDLWVKVVRDKYKCGDDLLPRIEVARTGSNLWKGIKQTWGSVLGGIETTNDASGVRWKWERHGEFSVKSAYKVISGELQEEGRDWGRLWKVRAPHRCKTLLWLVARQRLLTNSNRVKRMLTIDPSCPCCGADVEDTLHVMRDCPHSRALWRKVVPPDKWRVFCTLPVGEWIWWNVRGHPGESEDWASRFMILCWWIWKRRNLTVFEGKSISNDSMLASACAMLDCMQATNDRLAGLQLQGVSLTPSRESWRPPEDGWVKVNVDGAYSPAANKRACGGLIRDSAGDFLKGFIMPLTIGDELTAEIWACFLGLKMAWGLGARQVCMETDSSECLELLLQDERTKHRDSAVIMEVKMLLQLDWSIKLSFVPRSGNAAADFLAKKGLDSRPGYHEVYVPCEALSSILIMDCNGGANSIVDH